MSEQQQPTPDEQTEKVEQTEQTERRETHETHTAPAAGDGDDNSTDEPQVGRRPDFIADDGEEGSEEASQD